MATRGDRSEDVTGDPWAPYRATILEIARRRELEPAEAARRGDFEALVVIDLRAAVDPATAAQLVALLGPSFVVVTPERPMGRHGDPAEDARRVARFRAELDASGARWLPADGRSPDAAHRERGAAIVRPLDAGIALARRWEQRALYAFADRAFTIVAAMDRRASERLPVEG